MIRLEKKNDAQSKQVLLVLAHGGSAIAQDAIIRRGGNASQIRQKWPVPFSSARIQNGIVQLGNLNLQTRETATRVMRQYATLEKLTTPQVRTVRNALQLATQSPNPQIKARAALILRDVDGPITLPFPDLDRARRELTDLGTPDSRAAAQALQ